MGELDASGCRFVTRLKTNTPTASSRSGRLRRVAAIVIDRMVRVRRPPQSNALDPSLERQAVREVHVVIDSGKTLRLVTNDLTSPAEDDRRTLQDPLGDRTVLPLDQADAEDPQVPRHERERRARADRGRARSPISCCAWPMQAQSSVGSMLTFARLVRANLMHLAIDPRSRPSAARQNSSIPSNASLPYAEPDSREHGFAMTRRLHPTGRAHSRELHPPVDIMENKGLRGIAK